MTCFWDGILKKLNNEDFQRTFECDKPNNIKLVKLLKESNDKLNFNRNITWNKEKLTDKQWKENYDHIRNYQPKTIYNGYMCSSCEPFLILICLLFKVNINHNYCGNIMRYEIKDPIRTLNFKSNNHHFW